MNRIFRVLWNAATGTFVVTSETAKSRGKKAAAESWRFPHSSVLAALWFLRTHWPMLGTIQGKGSALRMDG